MRAFAIAILVTASPASAGVVSAEAHGFEIRQTINLVVPPAQAYAAFSQVQRWWSKDHTYSGDSANLSLQMRPGGCFCEQLDKGGGVEHMRVTFLQPGERVVLTGSLGPLLTEATTGVMDVTFERIAGGSRITLDYRAAGFARGNGTELALGVDKVLGEQMQRLRAFATGGGGKT